MPATSRPPARALSEISVFASGIGPLIVGRDTVVQIHSWPAWEIDIARALGPSIQGREKITWSFAEIPQKSRLAAVLAVSRILLRVIGVSSNWISGRWAASWSPIALRLFALDG